MALIGELMTNFKIDGPDYESRKEDLRTLIDHLGPDRVLESYKDNPGSTLHGLYNRIWFDRKNPDSHPSFVNGSRERLFPYQEDYEIYPGDSNDEHIRTMLKRAIYEILPATKSIDKGRNISTYPGV